MLRQPPTEEYRGAIGGLVIGEDRKQTESYAQQKEVYIKELMDQIQEKKLKDNQRKMERLKWEYEEEMRVRSEVAELNKKFKTENGPDRQTKQ